ncbi:SufS family cysteine desulfurase [Ferrimicrobium sp.]|uniref:aminotransferase class V-fold PLP-dependent enzyme n=1 Tax=Ferrimicrobium sp. TaxID=2926050 RepID=UPI00260BA80C|nr:SufS family cysteine desulfurase [Ferrimicrobium sp.]
MAGVEITEQLSELRKDFPIFADIEATRPFYYLDSAASSQRPAVVIDTMNRYYRHSHANVHRGVYGLAEEATGIYEAARRHLGRFIGASDPVHEIVFTKNATEALNLVVQGLGRVLLTADSHVLLTEMEHHANLVPWMILQEQLGFTIEYLPFDAEGLLVLDDLDARLERASILGVTLMSNVLGTLNPVAMLSERAHAHGVVVVGDGAQFVPHFATDVRELGVDCLAITGHKMLAPTGIGALWAKAEILEQMLPFLGGGEMISDVRLDGFTAGEIPHKFEAGTPPIAEAAGWDAALDYLEMVGMDAISRHDRQLTTYAMRQMRERLDDRIKIFGPQDVTKRGGVLSFELADVHPHDVAQVLDQHGVCVRAGHHCAKPLMRELGVGATARASFYLYNDEHDVDALVDALLDAYQLFHG